MDLDLNHSAPSLDEHPPANHAPTPLFHFDPGWLFLISGIVLIAAVVLIPAQHDLDDARWQRDRALAIEHHRIERLERYGAYLSALKANDECVLLSLAATQLNVSPEDRVPLQPGGDATRATASVFPALEPGRLELPPPTRTADPERRHKLSILERLSINNGSRLWLIAAGTLCTLLGLLPTAGRAIAGSAGSVAGRALGVAGVAIGAGAGAAAAETLTAVGAFRDQFAVSHEDSANDDGLDPVEDESDSADQPDDSLES